MAEILIIHGNGNEGWQISPDSFARCNRGLEILAANPHIKEIFCTGGSFVKSQKGIKNSDACANYLRFRGVSKDIDIREIDAKTTIDDALNSLPYIGPDDIVHIVTSDYHLGRTRDAWMMVAKKQVKLYWAPSGEITLRRQFIECVGMLIVAAYAKGFKFPENAYKRLCRTI